MSRRLLVLVAILGLSANSSLLGSAVASEPATSAEAITTVVVVRHAEKQLEGQDPDLTDAGKARAASLASRYCQSGVKLVIATEYRRTQATAEPCAALAGVKVQIVPNQADLKGYAETLRQRLLAEAAGGKVLVVGHSNTVPMIVQTWTGQAVTAISDQEYDRWFEIRFSANGQASLTESRYNATETAR